MARTPRIDRLLTGQCGSVAILFVLTLPVLFGFAALAVDLARLHLTKVELQNAADAAALAGAHMLTEPSAGVYNWPVADSTAQAVARRNVANAAQIRHSRIETGYWNLQAPSLGLRDHSESGVPVTGDVPAVRATIAISSTENDGPLNFFFAPLLGIFNSSLSIADSDIQASAVAVVASTTGGSGMFPFAVSQCILDELWDSGTNSPKINPATGHPYIFEIGTIYPASGCFTGQWTTFAEQENSVPAIRQLIADGNPTHLSVGDDTWIEPGVKATLYDEVPIGIDVPILVVDNVVSHSYQPIVAIAGFHISDAGKHGNKSYVKGHFIENYSFSSLDPGSGPLYGALSRPVLVE
ncbi:hypothetical protein INT08_02160 [Prosthecochloris sp. N3]|uniref:Putative Flp pilus-assembly TadG-like N-terminal domain-containing protein n=1 Tax=Prosthecochloris ethylica TaxID=2743976 RepID=A0ABR9XPS3_9CHLB|nr:pilus assembly protein TadG-related protein [Prosthecochloris ethylica]MBF0586284.1 hypothetical protein [Prosthecochloris ethylica]MBF0635990.1 hypothetical protein [Prosthecochloris ethylica]NUK47335.1 hypothetical protein [Prosthecochloris ethylica]